VTMETWEKVGVITSVVCAIPVVWTGVSWLRRKKPIAEAIQRPIDSPALKAVEKPIDSHALQTPVTTTRKTVPISPMEIVSKIEGVPDLQKADLFANNYKGLHVEWTGRLSSASKDGWSDGKLVNINLICPYEGDWTTPHALVQGSVPLSDYPELKLAHAGTRVTISGDIYSHNTLSIGLNNCHIAVSLRATNSATPA